MPQQASPLSGWQFVELCADRPGFAIWRHTDGREKVYAAPRKFRPKCQHKPQGQIPCPRHCRPGSPYCKKHQTTEAA